MQTNRLPIESMQGMVQVYRQPAGVADLVEDMCLDQLGAWSEAPGYAPIVKRWRTDGEGGAIWSASDVDSIETLFWWSQHNGTRQWLVFEEWDPVADDLSLRFFNPKASGDRETIVSGRWRREGAWQRTQYLAYNGWMYFTNGYDRAQRWNGERVEDVGYDRLPAAPRPFGPDELFEVQDEVPEFFYGHYTGSRINHPTQRGVGSAAEDPGAGLGPFYTDWRYGYAVTVIDEMGMESPPSAINYVQGRNQSSNPQSLATDGKRYVAVEIPQAPDKCRAIRLWRTDNVFGVQGNDARSTKLFLHTEFPSGMGGLFFDGKDDSELGFALDTSQVGLWPPGVKYWALFKGTMFVSGMPEYPDQVRYSSPFVEQMPAANFFNVGDRDAGEITGLRATKNALVVFKARGIYLIKGDPLNGFYAETLTEDVGGAAPNALVEVPGMGLLFVSDEGIMLLEGALENTGTPTRVRHLSRAVQRTWDRRVAKSNLMAAQAVVWHHKREVWVHVPAIGGSVPTLGFVFHYEQGQWSIRPDWPINCFAESRDHRQYLFAGMRGDDVGVHALTDGWGTRNGQALSCSYTTGWLDMGSRAERVLLQSAELYGLSHGERSVTMAWARDRREEFETQTLAADQEDTERKDSVLGNTAPPKWGTALWASDESYTEYHPCVVKYDLYQQHAVKEAQLKFSAERMTIIGLSVGLAKRGRGEGIDTLSTNISTEVR